MTISGKEMLKLYLKEGWKIERIKGSHHHVRKGNKKEIIPVHKNEDLARGLEIKLLKALKEKK